MRLSHHRAGSGDPVLLIHGVGSQWQIWEPVIDRVAHEREVIAVDLPGMGGSPTLPIGVVPNVAALTDRVAAFMDEQGLERPVVGGHSLGGFVALELAARGRAKSVVAVSPAGFGKAWEAAIGRANLRLGAWVARNRPELVEWLLRRPRGRVLAMGGTVGKPVQMPAPAAIGAARNLAASTGFEPTLAVVSRERFTSGDRVEVPVALVWGSKDLVLLPWQARRAQGQMPHARHVPLPGAGHVPTWDAPDEIARELLSA
jgi:pimeloyl-ACP methyl ester carboxylesterase